MSGLIIAGGVLGSLYMATFIFCLLLSLESTNIKFQPLWSIPVAVLDAFKASLIVFWGLLVAIACLIVMLAPLFLSLYSVGFFN